MTFAVVPLKYVASLNDDKLPESTDQSQEFRYLDIGSVGRGYLTELPESVTFDAAPSRARRLVAPGDTIISTVRTYLRAVWAVEGPTDDLVVSTGFAVVRPRKLDATFLRWAVQSDTFIEEVVGRSTGVSYPAINPGDLAMVPVYMPPAARQRRIADFLDDETARIDALIDAKQQMISLLDERRWLVLASEIAVSDYPRVPLRRALVGITDGPFGSAFSSGDYVDNGMAVVRLGNIGFAEWRGSDLAHLSTERFGEFRRHRVNHGDLLIAGLGDARNHAGRACVAPDLGPAIVKGKCFCARVDPARAIADYLAMFCSSPAGADAISVEARGSTRSMINLDIVKAMVVPLPDPARQVEIVGKVRGAWEVQDRSKSALRTQIALLRERRQALITAAVTGEIEV